MPLRRVKVALFALLVGLLAQTPALAASFEELVMPGKVIEGHAEYEKKCTKCHQPFSKSAQAKLCLNCHEKVGADISDATGYHGRIPGVKEMECKRCHSDHLGRGADVVQLDRETFNHDLTDFKLKGAHTAAACDRCHKSDKKLRETLKNCLDCHKEDDPHGGRLGESCNDCHNERRWTSTDFDHEDTDFPLQAKHKEVLCNACHPNERYEKTPKTCHACHRLSDVHNGSYGDKCENCHTPKDWDKPTFNHDKDTEYTLEKAHRKVRCSACHTSNDLWDEKTPTTCHGCHRNDDEHKGRYGDKCENCHTPTKWDKATFDHNDKTDFKLRGSHEDVACKKCHRGSVKKKEKRSTECLSCHRKDDAHKGQQGERCDQCHNETGWSDQVLFDHDITRFPLIGLHAVTPCEECHLGSQFRETALDCDTCHEADDVHKRTLGPNCANCHNPNDWGLWVFDHNIQTDFELGGAHEGLACDGCHQRPMKKTVRLSSACGHCHQQDDIHDGGFGPHCARCHTTDAFDSIRIEN